MTKEVSSSAYPSIKRNFLDEFAYVLLSLSVLVLVILEVFSLTIPYHDLILHGTLSILLLSSGFYVLRLFSQIQAINEELSPDQHTSLPWGLLTVLAGFLLELAIIITWLLNSPLGITYAWIGVAAIFLGFSIETMHLDYLLTRVAEGMLHFFQHQARLLSSLILIGLAIGIWFLPLSFLYQLGGCLFSVFLLGVVNYSLVKRICFHLARLVKRYFQLGWPAYQILFFLSFISLEVAAELVSSSQQTLFLRVGGIIFLALTFLPWYKPFALHVFRYPFYYFSFLTVLFLLLYAEHVNFPGNLPSTYWLAAAGISFLLSLSRSYRQLFTRSWAFLNSAARWLYQVLLETKRLILQFFQFTLQWLRVHWKAVVNLGLLVSIYPAYSYLSDLPRILALSGISLAFLALNFKEIRLLSLRIWKQLKVLFVNLRYFFNQFFRGLVEGIQYLARWTVAHYRFTGSLLALALAAEAQFNHSLSQIYKYVFFGAALFILLLVHGSAAYRFLVSLGRRLPHFLRSLVRGTKQFALFLYHHESGVSYFFSILLLLVALIPIALRFSWLTASYGLFLLLLFFTSATNVQLLHPLERIAHLFTLFLATLSVGFFIFSYSHSSWFYLFIGAGFFFLLAFTRSMGLWVINRFPRFFAQLWQFTRSHWLLLVNTFDLIAVYFIYRADVELTTRRLLYAAALVIFLIANFSWYRHPLFALLRGLSHFFEKVGRYLLVNFLSLLYLTIGLAAILVAILYLFNVISFSFLGVQPFAVRFSFSGIFVILGIVSIQLARRKQKE